MAEGTAHIPSLFQRLQWAFPVAVAIHNTEEGVWLPSWAAQHTAYVPWRIGASQFRGMAVVLTALALVVTWASLRRSRDRFWTYLFLSYTAAMFLNVFVPHIPASLYFRSYVPGVLSAVFVVLPVTALLLFRAIQERIIASWSVGTVVFGLPLAGAAVAAVLFAARLPS